MPWDNKTYGAVCAGLRDSAKNGEFVPHVWSHDLQAHDTGGCIFTGCAWGVIGWVTAVMLGGTNWAAQALPSGCTQGSVNQVLLHAGLSVSEISHMDPAGTWQYFDSKLAAVYKNRHQDPDTFIDVSMELAEFFITVISRVPVDGLREAPHLPYHVLTIPQIEQHPPLFLYAGLEDGVGTKKTKEFAVT